MANSIQVVGLGAGTLEQLPLGIYNILTEEKKRVFVRTKKHPVVQQLENIGVEFRSFDSYYEDETSFQAVYERVVATLIEEAYKQPVIYAVPGHPMLAEQTVQQLIEQPEIHVQVIGGKSYLDDLFTALKIDPIDGFQFVDATNFERETLNYKQHLIFCQVFDRLIASEVKLQLLEDLPADYEVTIVQSAGMKEEKSIKIPLQDLDRAMEVSNLTTVYVPPAPKEILYHRFEQLRNVIQVLRGPHGCPWDKEQTHVSLRDYAIEEVYELVDAINKEDDEGIIEELGDILLQVMLHSQIGEDAGFFTIYDVIKGITEKMIHRHPHVFEDPNLLHTKALSAIWEERKGKEANNERASMLDRIPLSMPSLFRAIKLQKIAAKVGFDWEDVSDVWEKMREEVTEVHEAIDRNDYTDIEGELGDLLFVIANLARHYNVNPEIALQRTNEKFASRFSYMENELRKRNRDITQTDLQEMEHYWEEAKRKGNN